MTPKRPVPRTRLLIAFGVSAALLPAIGVAQEDVWSLTEWNHSPHGIIRAGAVGCEQRGDLEELIEGFVGGGADPLHTAIEYALPLAFRRISPDGVGSCVLLPEPCDPPREGCEPWYAVARYPEVSQADSRLYVTRVVRGHASGDDPAFWVLVLSVGPL